MSIPTLVLLEKGKETKRNIGFIDNITAILEGQPLKIKVTLSKVELEQAITEAGLNDFNHLNAAKRIKVKRSIYELAKIDMAVFVYIISATLDELPPETSIQVAVGERIACGSKRVFDPQGFIGTTPNVSNYFYKTGKPYRLFGEDEFKRRILINQRISFDSFTQGKSVFDKIKKNGYLYIEEMDDHPNRWKKDYQKSGMINFISVHAIQTSTEYLAEYFRQLNPVVKVFENHLKSISPLRDFKKQKNSPVRIFFGALNRDDDFKDILPLINETAKKYGNKLQFKILANKELFDALEAQNKILVGDPEVYNGQFVEYEKYVETLNESDIALLPLLDNEFNRAKSDLKFIECAGAGVAVLASPVVYSKNVKDGENGLIFKDKKEFVQKLNLLIDNREKRYELATAAYDYVKNNRLLSQHYEERIDWYNELFERLDELTTAAQARIDKIAPKFKDELPPDVKQIEGKNKSNAEIIIPDTR